MLSGAQIIYSISLSYFSLKNVISLFGLGDKIQLDGQIRYRNVRVEFVPC